MAASRIQRLTSKAQQEQNISSPVHCCQLAFGFFDQTWRFVVTTAKCHKQPISTGSEIAKEFFIFQGFADELREDGGGQVGATPTGPFEKNQRTIKDRNPQNSADDLKAAGCTVPPTEVSDATLRPCKALMPPVPHYLAALRRPCANASRQA